LSPRAEEAPAHDLLLLLLLLLLSPSPLPLLLLLCSRCVVVFFSGGWKRWGRSPADKERTVGEARREAGDGVATATAMAMAAPQTKLLDCRRAMKLLRGKERTNKISIYVCT
jgi:hypothetical protein